MPLKFHLAPGMVLMCDFTVGFKPPEITKLRPVVVISPRSRRSKPLCTVVPLSTVAPKPIEPFHHCMDPRSLPRRLARKENWAKCDMLYTVSLRRLDRIVIGKERSGKPIYATVSVTADDLEAIRRGVRIALGMVEPA